MVALDGHRTAEQRSLAYHRRVAEKLVADPSILERARTKLKPRLEDKSGDRASQYAHGWCRLIDGPLELLVAFLQSEAQVARDFRQASPFAGALDPRERWELWRRSVGSSEPGGQELHPR